MSVAPPLPAHLVQHVLCEYAPLLVGLGVSRECDHAVHACMARRLQRWFRARQFAPMLHLYTASDTGGVRGSRVAEWLFHQHWFLVRYYLRFYPLVHLQTFPELARRKCASLSPAAHRAIETLRCVPATARPRSALRRVLMALRAEEILYTGW